jgi:hypothetical protein
MKVLITGLPMFAKQLADHLAEADPSGKYLFFDTYYSKFGKLKFLMHLPFCSHVISMNGVSDNSGILNWVLRFRKKLILQWMGTDSLYAMERYHNGTINRRYIDYAVNAIDSQWLEEELKSIELDPVWLEFKFSTIDTEPISNYSKMVAVTYIAENRQVFYGLEWVKRSAELFPSIGFQVFGMSNPEVECPENVTFFGWQPASVFMEAVRNAPLFLRFTEHDGFSVSVIEALSTGAETMMTLPCELTTLVQNKDELESAFNSVIERITERGMKPNLEIAKKSKLKWNKQRLMSNYVQFLKNSGK